MHRQNDSRPLAPKSVTRLLAALVTFSLGALALLLVQPAAHADSADVPLGKSSYTVPVEIETGGTVTFSAIPTQGANLLLYSGMYLTGPGANGYFIKAAQPPAPPPTLTITFPSAGSAHYTWKPKCTCGVHSWSVTVEVTDPPPPPDSSTPVDPGSSTSIGGSSTPGGPTSSVPTSPGATTSAGASGTSSGHGGISFPSQVINQGGGIPLGFNGPPADPNNPTPTIPNAIGTGKGAVPTGALSSGASSSSSSQTLVEVANSKPVSKTRPTSLAIMSIAVLAIVSSVYAYRRLGESVQRPLH